MPTKPRFAWIGLDAVSVLEIVEYGTEVEIVRDLSAEKVRVRVKEPGKMAQEFDAFREEVVPL